MVTMFLANGAAPARGAPLEDLVPATMVALVAIAALAWVAISYRRGGAGWLRALAALAARVGRLPTWAGLPALVAAASLICAMFGFYWDVSTHIDSGRDPGPFANPSHYFILAGLAGIALAGFLSLLLAREEPRGPVFVGFAPLGGVFVTLCGLVAVAGFPLDDVWHRLFGQDVTLWGPTHIQMVGGAALTTLASWILVREGRFYQSEPESNRDAPSRRSGIMRFREPSLAGALLIGLSALQAEFDFGVPQFQLVYQPILLMLAAGIALVAARIRLGRGGAIFSVAFFLLLRGALAIIVGPVLGRTTPHFPLYLVEALLVEVESPHLTPAQVRSRKRSRNRDDRARRGVGMEPHLDAHPVAGRAAARGGRGGVCRGSRRRGRRRVHRRCARQRPVGGTQRSTALRACRTRRCGLLPRLSGANQSAAPRRSRPHPRLRRTRGSSCRDRHGSPRPTGFGAGPAVVRRDVVAGARMGQRVEEARRAGAHGSG